MPSLQDPPATRSGPLLFALCFAGVVAGAVPAVVVPVLPDIAAELHVSPGTANWAVTAGLLTSAVTVPVFGRIADLRTGRGVLVCCLAVLTLGAVLSALASSFPLFLLGRALQGTAGAVFPLAVTVLYREVGGDRLTSAVALVSGTLAVGGGLGPVAAGLLDRVCPGYRVLFWGCAAVAAGAVLLIVLFVPRRTVVDHGGRVDVTGAAVLGTGLVLVMLPLSQGGSWGWTSPAVPATAVAAAVVLAVFVRVERGRRDPLLALDLLRRRPIVVANVLSALVGAVMYLAVLTLTRLVRGRPESAGYGFGASALTASVVYLLPMTIAAMIAAPIGGRSVVRFGARFTLVAAGVAGVGGFGVLTVAHDRPYQVVAASFAIGVMVSLGYAAIPSLLARFVPASRIGMANSANALTRWIGGAAASSFVAAVLAAFTTNGGPPREGAIVLLSGSGVAVALTVVLLARFGLPAPPTPRRGLVPAVARVAGRRCLR